MADHRHDPDRYLPVGDRVVRLDDSESQRASSQSPEHHLPDPRYLALLRTPYFRGEDAVRRYGDDRGGVHGYVSGGAVRVGDRIVGRKSRVQFPGVVRHGTPGGSLEGGVRRARGERANIFGINEKIHVRRGKGDDLRKYFQGVFHKRDGCQSAGDHDFGS